MISLKEIYAEDILVEASFRPTDIPERFYVSVRFKNLEQLVVRKLIGVKGITSSVEVAESFNHASPIMIVMPGPETYVENKLSMVNYDNPDYLAANNLAAYKRITMTSGETFFKDIFLTVLRIVEKDLPAEQWEEDWAEINAYVLAKQALNTHEKTRINSLNDLCIFMKSVLSTAIKDPDFKLIKNSASTLLQREPQFLEQEKEWIVKDNALNVPEGSELKIHLRAAIARAFPEDPKRLIQQRGLHKHYKIDYY